MARRPLVSAPKNLADWRRDLKAVVPQTGVPGYWRTLAESTPRWAAQVSACDLWLAAGDKLDAWRAFHTKGLLASDGLPSFVGKEKIEDKAFRWRENKEGPGTHLGVWVASQPVPLINDMVRCRVSCRFLDGVEFIGNKLEDLAGDLEVETQRHRRALPNGYFAQHIYFKHRAEFRFARKKYDVEISCEVQIATGTSTQVWDAAHGLYEAKRGGHFTEDDRSHWDPKNPFFAQRQVGHLAHLADALLMQLRDADVSAGKGKS